MFRTLIFITFALIVSGCADRTPHDDPGRPAIFAVSPDDDRLGHGTPYFVSRYSYKTIQSWIACDYYPEKQYGYVTLMAVLDTGKPLRIRIGNPLPLVNLSPVELQANLENIVWQKAGIKSAEGRKIITLETWGMDDDCK